MSTYSNKRIAKNTMFLYFRMLLVMMVSIYTSRVILSTLGVSDFGIYNVVGGVVAFWGFLNGSMANAVQRFLSFELGRGDVRKINHVFCSALIAHFSIALFIVIVLECVGPWFISNQLMIPFDRLYAAHWIFQCAVVTIFFTIIQVPYNAIIIAKEHMGIYAYISIVEVTLKLGIVYLLLVISYDRLITYAILNAIVAICVIQFYRVYCIRNFSEAKFTGVENYIKLKEIASFAVCNLMGEIAWSLTNQGVAVLVNIFAGPVANASQGISVQVNNALTRFVDNFQTALNPQIVKSYSSSEYNEMVKLVSRGSRLSFFLLLLLSLPLFFEMEYVLQIWLKEVPKDTKEFCQLTLICSLLMTITNLLVQVIRATGNIRNYQFFSAIILILNFPMAWFALKWGFPPYMVLVTLIVVQAINSFLRLYYVKKLVDYPIEKFVKRDITKMFHVFTISSLLPLLISYNFEQSNARFIAVLIVTPIMVLFASFFWGLDSNEKEIVKMEVKKRMDTLIKL